MLRLLPSATPTTTPLLFTTLFRSQSGALPLACERETADREDGFDVGFLILEEVVVHDVQRLLSPGQRAARRSLDQRDHHALVFFGQEAAGQAREQQRHDAEDQQVDYAGALPAAGRGANALFVLFRTPVELVVEPDRKSVV